MGRADSRIALVAVVPALAISATHLLSVLGVPDFAVGFAEGASIGFMLLGPALAIKARAGRTDACARHGPGRS